MSVEIWRYCLVISSILLAGCIGFLSFGEEERLKFAAKKYHGKQLEQGAVLYSVHCANCHGIRGEGVGQLGPALNGETFFKSRLAEVGWLSTLRQYVMATTEHGRLMGTRSFYAGNGTTAVMPPWHKQYGGPLRSDQIKAITSFVINWEATATGAVVLQELIVSVDAFSTGDAKNAGREIFINHCNRCHSYGDLNNVEVEGPNLTQIGRFAETSTIEMDAKEYVMQSVLIPDAHVVEEYTEISKKDGCGAVLTATDLENVTDFLLH